ncbi:MAG: hypothetical protein ACHQF0_06240 [Chitinophagales bacterium]
MTKICPQICSDVIFVGHIQKDTKYDKGIRLILISEAMPHNLNDYFDSKGIPQFIANTNFFFNKMGFHYKTYEDYLKNGIYLTTALKCQKKDYLVKSETIEKCSYILEQELNRFKNVKAILLMGDFSIKAINYIWKRKFNKRVIPAGSTYKLRVHDYECDGIQFLPSYTQTGDSFGIEKSKLRMIEEDIRKAIKIVQKTSKVQRYLTAHSA